MGHLADHLLLRVERLRVISGASGASAYLPAPWPGATEPLLLHTGLVAPVAELRDLEHAHLLHQRHHESAGPEAAKALLRIVASETPGAVRCPSQAQGHLAAGVTSPSASGRRLSDREPVALAGWLGLAFTSGHWPRMAWANWSSTTSWGWPTRSPTPSWRWTCCAATRSPDCPDARRCTACSRGPRPRGPAAAPVLARADPDGFERINERLGQSAGNHALREVVLRLQGALRTDDLVIRYGAATLAIVLPGTGTNHAAAVAGKVRRALSSDDYLSGQARLTFCAGAVTWQPGEAAPRDAIEFVQRADSALALARSGGGDRFEAWSAESDPRSAPRIDRLGGVFTGDQNKDYRNLALLWDALTGAWSGGTPAELADRLAQQLLVALRPSFVGIYEVANGTLGSALAVRRDSAPAAHAGATPYAEGPAGDDLDLLRGACVAGEARHAVARGQHCVLAIPVKAASTTRSAGCCWSAAASACAQTPRT